MTIAERNDKLKHFIVCLKCEVSGKCCDDNCPTQYDAGTMGEIIENLEAISKALEREPCEDAVSRQAVHDLMATWLSDYLLDETREALEVIDAKVEDLPSVTPHPKTGRWIRVEQGLFDSVSIRWECSECKKSDRFRSNFCFNCGAKMESEDEE